MAHHASKAATIALKLQHTSKPLLKSHAALQRRINDYPEEHLYFDTLEKRMLVDLNISEGTRVDA
jgi:hypothetical protein